MPGSKHTKCSACSIASRLTNRTRILTKNTVAHTTLRQRTPSLTSLQLPLKQFAKSQQALLLTATSTNSQARFSMQARQVFTIQATHCYHVKVGTVIEQEASQSTIGHQCSGETFEKQYRVGHLDTEMSETKQHYTGGTVSEGCKVNGNTAGTRAGTLVVRQDPDVKEHFAEVTESSTCVYDVTINVPAC